MTAEINSHTDLFAGEETGCTVDTCRNTYERLVESWFKHDRRVPRRPVPSLVSPSRPPPPRPLRRVPRRAPPRRRAVRMSARRARAVGGGHACVRACVRAYDFVRVARALLRAGARG